MSEQQDQHFDRAAEHFRDVIVAVQDMIYGVMGIVGALIVAVNSLYWDTRPREARQVVAIGVVLMAIAGIRWIIRANQGHTAKVAEFTESSEST